MSAADTLTPALLRERPLPAPGASKNTRGRVLVVGGSRTNPGGALLAGLAALRVGAGVLAIAVPDEVAIPLAISVPEAAVTGWTTANGGGLDVPSRDRLAARLDDCQAVLVGPGIDDPAAARALIADVAEVAPRVPIVIDAYALAALPEHPELAWSIDGRCVLTPNHAEAGLLLGTDVAESASREDDVEIAARIAGHWHAAVSFQGAVATTSGATFRPSTGNSGLGTSGSGDVLAGAICGLLARGADLDQATCWATYLHAAAGDRLAARIGRLGYLARELVDELPLVLDELTPARCSDVRAGTL